jgi:hypothetical protein
MDTFQPEMLKGRDINKSRILKWNLTEQGGSVRWIRGRWLALGDTVMVLSVTVSFSLLTP